MKKLLFVLAIGAFAACGSGESTEAKADSTANVIDSSASAKKDSVSAVADTVKKAIDSSAAAAKDTLKK
ncbi:hypothetical protein SAMN05421788_11458 [Filimonas lacunae]|uniref:Lipoprotein n=1 Tax=Filimonas lacunae TaxID=477680 RepID=A0A173MLW8_9BACT|nr:hypothetical protein [Filimonas lacunae]BAV08476.1 hypothetical protein FLA_4517 [Filimonas lacunae]SIT33995.1 hypothetical protein SAMN05421788_11458 [Filimonas lacunae]